MGRAADKGHSEKTLARFMGALLAAGADPTLGEEMGKDAYQCCSTQRTFQTLHLLVSECMHAFVAALSLA